MARGWRNTSRSAPPCNKVVPVIVSGNLDDPTWQMNPVLPLTQGVADLIRSVTRALPGTSSEPKKP